METHTQMAKHKGPMLVRGEKVVARTDLPGVPAGTRGRVILVDGFRWIRYRVHFKNGEELGTLDREVLARKGEDRLPRPSWR